LLLIFYELRRGRGLHDFHYIYSIEVRTLVHEGDKKLKKYSNPILLELLGQGNIVLHPIVQYHWHSITTKQELSILYRLNQYVGWSPRPLRTVDTKEKESFWIDIWKAWWACCFREREVWGDDIEDLLSCLRRIMALMYRRLVQQYATNNRVIPGYWSDRMSVAGVKHANVSTVKRGDDVIRKSIGHENKTILEKGDDGIREWIEQVKEKTILGYLAPTGIGIPIFSVDKDDAALTAFVFAKRGFKGNLF